MSSFSRFGKVEAGEVKSIHSDQISEPDGGSESTLDPPPPTPPSPPGGTQYAEWRHPQSWMHRAHGWSDPTALLLSSDLRPASLSLSQTLTCYTLFGHKRDWGQSVARRKGDDKGNPKGHISNKGHA